MLRRPPATWTVVEVAAWAQQEEEHAGAALPWLAERIQEACIGTSILYFLFIPNDSSHSTAQAHSTPLPSSKERTRMRYLCVCVCVCVCVSSLYADGELLLQLTADQIRRVLLLGRSPSDLPLVQGVSTLQDSWSSVASHMTTDTSTVL